MNASTKLAGLFSALPCFSGAALNLAQKCNSTMNILNSDLQPLTIQNKQNTQSLNHSLRIVPLFPFNRMKNRAGKLFFIVCIQGLIGVQQAYAATYYVSPTGVDSNSGTSLSAPVKTIKNALSKAQSSGDIVYVMTGTYAETVSIGQNGITLSAYPNNTPVIDGGSSLPSGNWGSLISVDGNSNNVSGFEVKNSNINGTYSGGYGVYVGGHDNTISKMNVHHTWENGILVQGDYSTVQDSQIWQAARHNTGQMAYGWAAGLSAARNRSASAIKPGITSYATFRRNKVFNNWGEGLSCYEADHCTIEDNTIYDNWTMNMYISDATNNLVQRNMIYVSSAPAIATRSAAHSGITLADEVATVLRSANNTIINNFIYNADFSAFSWTSVTNSGLNNVLIANNTIVDGKLSTGSSGAGVVNTNSQIRNNIILGANSSVPSNNGITFSNNNWAMTPSLAATVTDIVGDPQIARTGTTTPGTLTSTYFTLSAKSPVINAATPLTKVTDDFFKISRGIAPDIGGQELNGTSIATTSTDSTAPSTPASLSATVSSSRVNLTWNASTDNVSVVGYRIYRDGTQIGTSVAASFADTSITAGATYNYTVKAYDAAGNLSVASNTATVKIAASSTVSITSNYAGNMTANSATINWTTNVPATGVISYSSVSSAAANDLGLHATVSSSATSQSIQLPGLYNNTQYYYKITASNGSTTAAPVTSTFKTTLN